MSDKNKEVTLEKVYKVWEKHSYYVAVDIRRMTAIGFTQAIQEFGIKIVEK